MPPKAKAAAKDRDLAQDQLLYAIILQVGLPSGGEAWNQVAARIPDIPKSEASQAARHRWNRLKAIWDEMQLFGEKHYDIVEEALEMRGQPIVKNEKKKAQPEEKAKGKKAAAAVVEKEEETGGEVSDNDDEDEAGNAIEDSNETMAEPIVKKAVKPKKGKKGISLAQNEELMEDEEDISDGV
ncbi:hypothetical protein EG329_002778 [Mollisiaceae sp. DMI_Dod_QoI]|nr:hypothetical protein EG329_002778 [Helotiales sp. DMI_Dod_QoI]